MGVGIISKVLTVFSLLIIIYFGITLKLLILVEYWENRLQKLILQETHFFFSKKKILILLYCSCSNILFDLKLMAGEL